MRLDQMNSYTEDDESCTSSFVIDVHVDIINKGVSKLYYIEYLKHVIKRAGHVFKEKFMNPRFNQ